MSTDTNTTGAGPDPASAAQLRDRYLTLTERIDAAQAEREAVKAALRDLYPNPDRYDVGDGAVVVSANTRFNEDRALPLIDEAVLPFVTFTQTRVDRDKLKALAPDVYAQACDQHTARVSVR